MTLTAKRVVQLTIGLMLLPLVLFCIMAVIAVLLAGCALQPKDVPYTGECWGIKGEFVDQTLANPDCNPETYKICEPVREGEGAIPEGSDYCASHNKLEVLLCCEFRRPEWTYQE